MIEFPPRHVVLHPDDAGSKAFAAMYRAFMSVVRVLPSLHFSFFVRPAWALA